MCAFQELILNRVVGDGGNSASRMLPGMIESYINTLELHMQSMRELKQVPLIIACGNNIHPI